MNYDEKSLALHQKMKGKLSIESKVPLNNRQDLSVAYTPGVAAPCKEIQKNPEAAYTHTIKGNTVAVVSDGSAVLGLGNIGPLAAMPVMEGKAALFKAFAGIDAFPICLDTQDASEIIQTVKHIAPGFGGINLEDISAPRCLEIEAKLKQILDIPVFHDDQHGTAIVVSAALLNALKLSGQSMDELDVVINGAGAAGTAIFYMLQNLGVGLLSICDSKGVIHEERGDLSPYKRELAKGSSGKRGGLKEALAGAHVFIGVSAAGALPAAWISSMAKAPIIFAMANPVPEIMPEEALALGAFVVGTGRSDYANQVNNVLAFPGVFKGALRARATDINDEMKLAAAHALADFVEEEKLSTNHILPQPFEEGIAEKVAEAVYLAAIRTHVANIEK